MKASERDLFIKLKDILSNRERKIIENPPFSRAAVLVPLFKKGEECHLLFTKRTEQVKYHKGQISFPGGMFDKEDSGLEMTARREAFEEIGLKESDIEMIGILDDIVTITQFIVTPYVGFFPYPYAFQVSPIEIAELIEVPLSHLLAPECLAEREIMEVGRTDIVVCYQYGTHIIWGATARILRQFLELIPSDLLNC
jgi:8-oxo-dGTP pyrophosphatase MutT (NUDIX family)